MTQTTLNRTSTGVRVNTDSLAYIEALRAARPVELPCREHRAYSAGNCPLCEEVSA